MKFALEVRQGPENALEFSEKLRASILSAGGEVVEGDEPPDVVLAVGGDGTVLAAVSFDQTGTTRIGKYLLNHSFMLPGLVTTATATIVATVLARVFLR